jgi:hypothetical protein
VYIFEVFLDAKKVDGRERRFINQLGPLADDLAW